MTDNNVKLQLDNCRVYLNHNTSCGIRNNAEQSENFP